MKKFIDKRTDSTKQAFSLRKENGKVYVQFIENGKEYSYMESNIEIIEIDNSNLLIIYCFNQSCWSCKKETQILTYIMFDDEVGGNVTYPWDKNRLNCAQSFDLLLSHMIDESIEYYPIKTIGGDDDLDEIMLKEFPNSVAMRYSNVQKRKYPMNICQHCKTKQGEYYIYKHLNTTIRKMEQLKIFKEIHI